MNLSELLAEYNHTELYQLARRSDLPVKPNMSREALIQAVLGEIELSNTPHPLDDWRLAIMRFLIDHRRVVESQLTCPAKSMDPRACFNCVDPQVISCLVGQEKHVHLIELRKKK
jgi:hypothetical protein